MHIIETNLFCLPDTRWRLNVLLLKYHATLAERRVPMRYPKYDIVFDTASECTAFVLTYGTDISLDELVRLVD